LVKILVACFVVEGLFETNIDERFLRFGVFVESNNSCFGLWPKQMKMCFDV
jgi:hypothetical protein